MKAFYTTFLMISVLLCAGCRSKKKVVHREAVSSCEARLVDVPFPLEAMPRDLDFAPVGHCGMVSNKQDAHAQVAVEFYTALSSNELIHFYHREMEQLGWKELSVFTIQDESILLYEKPFKLCFIIAAAERTDK